MLQAVAKSTELRCRTCQKTFGKKYSLLRHLKVCQVSLTSASRQKSCDRCTVAKSKCDQQWPICGRCLSRQSVCNYKKPIRNAVHNRVSSPTVSSSVEDFMPVPRSLVASEETGDFITPRPILSYFQPLLPNKLSAPESPTLASLPSNNTANESSFDSIIAHFGDAEDNGSSSIDNETTSLSPETWLPTVVPFQEPLSPLKRHTVEFTLRMLRTWPHIMANRFQLPPVFHHTQVSKHSISVPLAHCYTIAKMWHGQCESSTALVHETTVREMTNLFQNYRKLDEAGLLAALQSMVIYMIILLFPIKDQASVSVVNIAILANLQQLINYVCSKGLVIKEEMEHVRPSWEDWIIITSRRRAVLSLYTIHWSLSSYHGLPSFDCEELRYMLAPAPKFLWQATRREEWESLYSHWLVEWEQQEYLQGELANIEPGSLWIEGRRNGLQRQMSLAYFLCR